MKNLNKTLKIIIITLMITIITPLFNPFQGTAIASAATVAISKKTCSLKVGKTTTLKITGTKSKIVWTSSNKKIATVSKAGKVTAKAAGKATITATVNKKKYTCKVTVTKAVNPYIAKAPFEAKEASIGTISFVIPKAWISANEYETSIILTPETVNDSSSVSVNVEKTDAEIENYSLLKKYVNLSLNEDTLKEQLAYLGDVSITNFKTSDFEADSNTAYKVSYTLNVSIDDTEVKLSQTVFFLFLKSNLISVTITDAEEGYSDDLLTVATYILDSIQIKK